MTSSMKKRKKLIDLTDATSTAKRVEEHNMKGVDVVNSPVSAASHLKINDGYSSGALQLVLMRTKKVLE